MNAKPKVAIFDFTDCEGCEVVIVSLREKILDLTIPDEVVLPESQRSVFCPLPHPLEPGTYKAVCEVDIGRPELLEMEKTIEVAK